MLHKMLQLECRGSPYEIGLQHGQTVSEAVARSIAFYEGLFLKYSKKSWPEVRNFAQAFADNISQKWPRFYQEMQGIADGSRNDILDIVALNVRTEIAFGLFSDGCTSVYCKTEKRALLGQNWDWMEEQKENLVLTTIYQTGLPTIKMVTEAGIIGKIGLNSAGVGVCFNAIRVRGIDPSRLPAHLALRTVLDSTSARAAVEALESSGMASSAYALIADATEAIGLEFTSKTLARQPQDENGRVVHTNHLLEEHPGVDDIKFFRDSGFRVNRMRDLTSRFDSTRGEPSQAEFSKLFEDEENYPGAICRAQEGISETATLFNIVMDLSQRAATIRVGRPCDAEDTYEIGF